MACPFRTPGGALGAVLACVTEVLGQAPYTVPTQVVTGPWGAANAYSCCEGGLLSVEWQTTQPDLALRRTTAGGGNCREDLYIDIKVTVDRCVQTYEVSAGTSTGAPVPIDKRNIAGLAIVDEQWAVIQGLLCCIADDAWDDCDVRFLRAESKQPYGACWGYAIYLRAYLPVCCN